MSFPALEKILSYQNDDVVARFAEDHGVSLSDSQEIFLEMKRWLWLCAKRKVALENGAEFFQVPLFNEAYAIDLMWHTFLLYTRDYADFCETHFGFFVHHQPRSQAERNLWQEKIRTNADAAWEERRRDLKKVYSYLYDELGGEILVKWCEEFPVRFKGLRKEVRTQPSDSTVREIPQNQYSG